MLIFFRYSQGGFICPNEDCSKPFRIQVSFFKSSGKETVVSDIMESRVMASELIAGILPLTFDLPQYLIKAKFGWAIAVADFKLYPVFVNHKFNASSIL